MLVKLRAVVFDLDGTFYRSDKYILHVRRCMDEVLAEFLGVGVEEAHRRLEEAKATLMTISASVEYLGMDRRIFYKRLAERVHPRLYIPRRPELREMLGELRSMRLRIGVHTNSGRPLAEKVLDALGLTINDFDACITSDDAEPKPSPQGYMRFLEIFDVDACEVVYVGDRWKVEVEPAKKLGMKTILVSPKLVGEPDVHVRDVMEVPKAVRSLYAAR